MVGYLSKYSDIFLYVLGIAMLIGYGLPLTIVPLRWARFFGWKIPEENKLTVILGQSLGILLLIISVFAFLAPKVPQVMPFYFNFILCIIGLMTILHVYGAIRKLQPKLETWEILLWVILFLLTLFFYPV